MYCLKHSPQHTGVQRENSVSGRVFRMHYALLASFARRYRSTVAGSSSVSSPLSSPVQVLMPASTTVQRPVPVPEPVPVPVSLPVSESLSVPVPVQELVPSFKALVAARVACPFVYHTFFRKMPLSLAVAFRMVDCLHGEHTISGSLQSKQAQTGAAEMTTIKRDCTLVKQ